jgi:hypothetical protein
MQCGGKFWELVSILIRQTADMWHRHYLFVETGEQCMGSATGKDNA